MPRVLRHLATGAATAAMLHAAVLGLSSRGEPYPDLTWMDSAEVMKSLYVLAPWPLTALILLWLASHRPVLYTRAALALLMAGGSELVYACRAPLTHLPAPEGSLFREYLALPGALTGWYLLTALAMATAVRSPRVRSIVVTAGLGAVLTCVMTSADPVHAGLFVAGVPLLAWFAAGRLASRGASRGRAARSLGLRERMAGVRTRAALRVTARGPVRARQAG